MGYDGVAAFETLTTEDYARVGSLKVFFQHASVGYNTVNGLKSAQSANSALNISFYSASIKTDAAYHLDDIKTEFTAETPPDFSQKMLT